MSDLEQRIRRIEDRFEIQDLVVRYFVSSDADDHGVVAELFAENGVFEGPGFTGGTNRAEILEFVRTFRGGAGQSVHTPDFALVEFVDDDNATGIVGAHIEFAIGGTTVFGAFRYHDNYVRENGRWRFARRDLLTIHVGPWDEIGTSLTCEKSIRWPGTEAEKTHFPKRII